MSISYENIKREEKMKVLVTGGAGFIGSHLVERLLREVLEVRVFDDFSTGCPENLAAVASRVELVEGDICDYEVVREAMPAVEVVSHQAALYSVV
jgi:UDP-glucose 4-epimerase